MLRKIVTRIVKNIFVQDVKVFLKNKTNVKVLLKKTDLKTSRCSQFLDRMDLHQKRY